MTETTGLRPGDEVVVLTGKESVPATLGDLECFAGECGGNWVSVALISKDSGADMLAVLNAAGAKGLKAVPVEVESVQGQCEEVLSQMSHADTPSRCAAFATRRAHLPLANDSYRFSELLDALKTRRVFGLFYPMNH